MLDKNLLVSDEQDLAQTAAAYLSDKSIDLGALTETDDLGNTPPQGDPGKGVDIEFMCQIVETFTSGGAATLKAELVMADDAALTSNLTVLADTGAIALATLVAGYNFRIPSVLQPGVTKRYLGARYTVGTATTTAGKVTAGIAKRQTVFY